MIDLVKRQLSEIGDTASSSFKVFQEDIENLSFSEKVSISSFLHVLSKVISDRRSDISDQLDKDISVGDVDNRELVESASGSSVSVDMPGFKVQRVVRSGSKRATVGNLERLLEKKGIEGQKEHLLKPNGEKLNKKRLAQVLEEAEKAGVDTSGVYEPSSYEVDVEKLRALASISRIQKDLGFEITEEDVDSVFEDVPESSYVKCTMEKRIQEEVRSAITGENSSPALEG